MTMSPPAEYEENTINPSSLKELIKKDKLYNTPELNGKYIAFVLSLLLCRIV